MVNKLIVVGLAVLLVAAMVSANSFVLGLGLAMAKRSSDTGSSGSSEGSNTEHKDSESNSGSGSSDNPSGDTGSNNDNKPVKEATPAEPITNPTTPNPTTKPNLEDQKICMIPEGCGNGIKSGEPTPDNPVPVKGPDNDCLFHPELDKCKSDNGKCPSGFFQNEDENCVPNHQKCPKGFHSHEDDETGRCISDKVPCEKGFIRNPDFPTCSSKLSVCRDHPTIKECSSNVNINVIIHRTGSSGSTSISKNCFDAIKIAWIGKVHRGQNSEVDKFIDKCLGVK